MKAATTANNMLDNADYAWGKKTARAQRYNCERKARKAWWGKKAAPKFSGVVHDFDMDPKARKHFEGKSRKERNVSRCATKRQERRAREAKMREQASSKSKKSSTQNHGCTTATSRLKQSETGIAKTL